MNRTQLYFSRNFFVFLFVVVVSLSPVHGQITQTFSYTGAMQSFTVPSCVTSVTIIASGAQGVGVNGLTAGNGGRVRGVLNGAGGLVLAVYVGGSNSAFNGGGLGQNGANGGGASDVRLGGFGLGDRIIVAGGGGGAGGDNWSCSSGTGHGGGGVATATSGLNFMPGAGGAGFTAISGCGSTGDTLGGTAGNGFHGGGGGGGGLLSGGAGATSTLGAAGSGSLGIGGSSLMSPFSCSVNGTGGGGGGYYGGGGAAGNDCGGGRGGGGSSWTGTLSSPGFTSGVQTGDGSVILIYNAGTNISASTSSTSVCAGSNVTLTASGMTSYTWSTGSSSPVIISNSASTSVSPGQTTTYTVSGTNTSSCILSSVLTVSVDLTIPTLSITANTNTLCQGVASSFTASGANSYTWSTGSTNSTLVLTPAFNATYSVVGKNACGISSSLTLNVNPSPTVSAVAITGTLSAAAASLCSGESVSLVASGANTYSWTGNVQNNVAFYPPISSFYSVIGTNTAGCSGTATVALTIITTPTAPIQSTSSFICAGSSATLSSVGYGNYTWLPSNLTTNSIVVSPTVSTTYTLTKDNFGCSDTKTFVLSVFAVPQLTAAITPSLVCLGSNAVLSASGANTYSWSPGNLTGGSVTISPLVNTVYSLTASNGNCSASTNLSLTVVAGPTVTVTSASTSICAGESAILAANGGNFYLWTPGNYTTQAVVVNPQTTTQYTLTGVLGTCSVTVYKTLTVTPSPTLIAIASKNMVCASETTTLFAGGANTYTWSTGVISTSTIVNPVVSTIYTLSGSYVSGCSSSKTIGVSVFEPTFALTGPSICCFSSTVQLIASGANTYTWNSGSHSPTLSVSPINSSTYTVSATSSSNAANCISTNTISLAVVPLPNVTATVGTNKICRGESTQVFAAGALTYTWNTLQTGSVAAVSPSVSFIYTVQGADANGCVDTAVVVVHVNLCAGLTESNALNLISISVFPNPSQGEVFVKSLREEKLILINQTGVLVLEVDLTRENNYESILKGVQPGVYYLVAAGGSGYTSKKIVVLN